MRRLNFRGSRSPVELVLFILWPNGQPHADRVLRTILNRFHPLVIRSLEWSRDGSRERLSELYGRSPDSLYDKDAEVGEGECTVLLAVDHRPRYAWNRRKPGLANAAAFGIKRQERRKTGLNFLHASDTEHDALEFAARLLDKPTDYCLRLKETALQSAGRPVPRSLSEVFGVLNERLRYVVLRNWQDLPDGLAPGHGDVDILVDDPAPVLASFPSIWKKHTQPYRVHFHLPLRVGPMSWLRSSWMPFDIRYVGDGYYEERWQREMLLRRVLSPRGFYHLCESDHFYAVLYHALLHKPRIRDDYRETLRRLGPSIAGWSDGMLDDGRRALAFLASRVPIQKPVDHSVHWNHPRLAAG